MIAKDIKRLSKSEKILLVQDLWDDIADDPRGFSATEDEVLYVNARLNEIDRTGEGLVSWDMVKTKTHKKKKSK